MLHKYRFIILANKPIWTQSLPLSWFAVLHPDKSWFRPVLGHCEGMTKSASFLHNIGVYKYFTICRLIVTVPDKTARRRVKNHISWYFLFTYTCFAVPFFMHSLAFYFYLKSQPFPQLQTSPRRQAGDGAGIYISLGWPLRTISKQPETIRLPKWRLQNRIFSLWMSFILIMLDTSKRKISTSLSPTFKLFHVEHFLKYGIL